MEVYNTMQLAIKVPMNPIKNLFLISFRYKFTPAILCAVMGVTFNHFYQQNDQEILQHNINTKNALQSALSSYEVKEEQLEVREKSFLAIYESHCKQYESVMGRDCTTGRTK